MLLLCSAIPVYSATPWLHADSNVIKDPAGNVVVLRGVDLIDLGFLEDWQGGAINMINRLTDTTDTQGTSPGWYPKVIRIDIHPPDSVSSWPHPFNPANNDLYNLLRSVVDYCASKDLYAIIDWHYVANTYDHVASTSEFWEFMAPRFAGDSNVIFELFNEPINNTFGSELNNWLSVRTDMQTWIDIVRTYAPNNLILVAGPNWSQAIGPAASNPVSDPLGGNNIAIVSHIYPSHWSNPSWFKNHIETCHAVYPVIMTEWGFSQSQSEQMLKGTITEYGQPLMDYIEGLGISNSAWVASYDWRPSMFWDDWTLRCGEGEMGCFVKDTLYARRNDDQPVEPPVNCQEVQDFGYRLEEDLNGDCFIELLDLLVMMYQWLSTSPAAIPPNYSPDLVVDNNINLEDFTALFEKWSTCNDPGGVGCIENW